MNNEGAGTAVFVLSVFAIALISIGVVFGVSYEERVQREKFIIYCTSKGDTYKNCDAIFNGKEPEVK